VSRSARSIRAVAVAGAVLVALSAACSSGEETSGGEKKKSTTTEATTTTATPDTVSDEDFDAAVAPIEARVEEASGNVCEVVKVFGETSGLPTPANAAQTERGVQLVVALFRAAAAAPPVGAEADAPVLERAADELLAEGESKGWDPAWLTSAPGPSVLSDSEVQAAFSSYQSKAAEQCGSAASDTTTTSAP
jgi:hypothetical protein